MQTTWQRVSEFNRSPRGRALAGVIGVLGGLALILLATVKDYAAGPGLALVVVGLVQLGYAAYLARREHRSARPSDSREARAND